MKVGGGWHWHGMIGALVSIQKLLTRRIHLNVRDPSEPLSLFGSAIEVHKHVIFIYVSYQTSEYSCVLGVSCLLAVSVLFETKACSVCLTSAHLIQYQMSLSLFEFSDSTPPWLLWLSLEAVFVKNLRSPIYRILVEMVLDDLHTFHRIGESFKLKPVFLPASA